MCYSRHAFPFIAFCPLCVDDISAIRAVLCPEPPLTMTKDVLSGTHDLPSFRHPENRLFDELRAIKQSSVAEMHMQSILTFVGV